MATMTINIDGIKLPDGNVYTCTPPVPTETERGGIIASEKSETDVTEVKIDSETGKAYVPAIPTKTSELTNDSNFIDYTGNAATATKLETARTINGIPFNGSQDISNYCTCNVNNGYTTCAAEFNTYVRGFNPAAGTEVNVKFNCLNSGTVYLSYTTLNVDETGAYPMINSNGGTDFAITPNSIRSFIFDGTSYVEKSVETAAECTGNAATATKLENKTTINGINFDGSDSVHNYGVCSTAAATAAKTVSCTGFTLGTGAEITVRFTNANTAASPTLNVNGTGAKPIYYRDAEIEASALQAYGVYTFRYSGSYWYLVGDLPQRGPVTLLCTNTGLYPGSSSVSYSDIPLPSNITLQVGDLLLVYLTNTICLFEVTGLGSSVSIKNVTYMTHPSVTTE